MSGFALKWGKRVQQKGFAQIPTLVFAMNQYEEQQDWLKPLDLLILLQLAGMWWKPNELPYPSVRTLAERCGTSERQVQRALKRLQQRGLIERINRRENGVVVTNAYDLSPLVARLEQIASVLSGVDGSANRPPSAAPRHESA